MDQQFSSSFNQEVAAMRDYSHGSALKMRLDTENQIEKVRLFLSGEHIHTIQEENTGRLKIVKQKVSQRLMNDNGVNHIVNYVGSIINPQVVQGNYDLNWYQEQLCNTHKRLAFILTTNRPAWEIEPTARYSIIGFVMEYIKPYLSRLIENKERESYADTVRTTESSTVQAPRNGILPQFGS